MDTPERNMENAAPKRRLNSTIVAAGVAFGITLAGLGVAAAQTDSSENTTSTSAAANDTTSSTEATTGSTAAPETTASKAAPAQSDTDSDKARAPRVAETELTGDIAAKVSAAALAAVPGGTVLRVETDADGSPYEAHVRKADGTEVVVKVDANFAVTGAEAGGGGGRGGHHRGGEGRGGAPASLTGEAADKVTSAALAAVPGGTVVRVQAGPDGGYHAHVTEADGTEVVVTLDADFKVTGTVDGATFGGGHRGPRPGDTGDTETD